MCCAASCLIKSKIKGVYNNLDRRNKREKNQWLINPRFDSLGAWVYDVMADKWESWHVEPQEGGEMAGSGLARLLVAESARMQICIQGKVTNHHFLNFLRWPKARKDSPVFVWSIAWWEMPLTLEKGSMQPGSWKNIALSSRGCEDAGLSPERGSSWRQFHSWWQNRTSSQQGSQRPEFQLQCRADKHAVCPRTSHSTSLSLDKSE